MNQKLKEKRKRKYTYVKREEIEIICKYCNSNFVSRVHNKEYCSIRCRKQFERKRLNFQSYIDSKKVASLPGEIWRDIVDYEGLYQVSNLGRVKSCNHTTIHRGAETHIPEMIRSLCLNQAGYPCVSLRKNGKTNYKRVHRLLAIAFLPNPNNKPCINHKDGVKSNCKLENLEWCTYSENSYHAYAMGLSKYTPPFSTQEK